MSAKSHLRQGDSYALTITGLTREQAKTLYAAYLGLSYGELIDPLDGTSGGAFTGRARAFWTTQQDVIVDIRPTRELPVMAELAAAKVAAAGETL